MVGCGRFLWARELRRNSKVFAGFLVIMLLLGLYVGFYTQSVSTTSIRVLRVESVSSADSHKYLIYSDGETFECTDSLIYGKSNSSDIYGQIQPNHRYRVKVVGWRLEFMSRYRNILEAAPED